MRIALWIAVPAALLAGCGTTASSTTTPAATAPLLDTSLLPHVKRCPNATGGLSGTTLGLVHLGMTRAQARHAYTQSTDRATPGEDFFCLTPIGIRVAYPSSALLRTLAASEQASISGRVIWASTANPRYSLGAIRPGSRLTRASALHPTGPIQVGLNAWYFAEAGPSTLVFKVRHGVIEEIGIADSALTGDAQADSVLIRSLPAISQGS